MASAFDMDLINTWVGWDDSLWHLRRGPKKTACGVKLPEAAKFKVHEIEASFRQMRREHRDMCYRCGLYVRRGGTS